MPRTTRPPIARRAPLGAAAASPLSPAPPAPLHSAIARARRRLLPFLLLMYVVAFLDRANIAFTKQALQDKVGISPTSYALGAGLFFLSYALLEIPSNLILHRVGAKRWMARIMVSWGLVSVATMFTIGPLSFYVLRLLLGAAEAGFFPGVILYLTYWFPAPSRTRILGLFYIGAPLAFLLGAPISSALLHMHPRGALQNWQWMFLLEGSLAVVVGAWSYWYLNSRPSDAPWLTADERAALAESLAQEEQHRRAHHPADVLPMLRDPRVARFAAIYFLIQASIYGVVFYLPTEASALLHKASAWRVNVASAAPWVCSLAAALWLPRLADRIGRRRTLAVLALLLSGAASAAVPFASPAGGMLALCIAASGFIAVQPLFWTFPANYLSDRAAAAGIALINAVGSLGGFIAPNVKVWAESHFHSPGAGAYLLAALTLAGAALTATLQEAIPSLSIRRDG